MEKLFDWNKVSAAYEAAERIKECPGGCQESKIPIKFDDGSELWVGCPVLSINCERGLELRGMLKSYCINNVKAIPGLPGRFHAALASPQSTDAVLGAHNWAAEPKTFLVLHGSHGVGKSFGAAYALYLLAHSRNAPNWRIPQQWAPLSAMWVSAYRATTRDELFEEARVKPILILDDLGAELPTSVSRYKIAEIISERNNHRRITILTMNDEVQELARVYGDRVADRVFGDCRVVRCGGESLRLAS